MQETQKTKTIKFLLLCVLVLVSSVPPIFAPNDSDGTIRVGIYSLTIVATSGGTTNPIPGTYPHGAGDNVTVKALPSPSYLFNYWKLDDVTRIDNPTTVTMNQNYTLTAYFKQAPLPPPPPPPPIMRLDLIIEKPAMVSYLWWCPTFTAEILVINKGTVASDVTFQWMLLDEDVKIAGGTQTVFISGLDKKQVYLNIATPTKTGNYTLYFQSIAPVEVETESCIEVTVPFYGPVWFTVIIVVIAVSITIIILVVRKQRLRLLF